MKNIFAEMPPSTASGNGPSTIGYQHMCGRQSAYHAAEKAASEGEPVEEYEAGEKLHPLLIGSAFHWLAFLRPGDAELKHHEDHTGEQTEAIRLYKAALKFGYFANWEPLHKELWLSNGAELSSQHYVTGQLDALAVVTTEGWLGLSKGDIVIMDYKTAEKKYWRNYYVDSAQTHTYVQLARKNGYDVKAFIYGEITRPVTLKPEHITYHMNIGPFWPLPIIEQWAADGKANFENKKRNLGVCRGVGRYSKSCAFLIQCMAEANEE